MRLALILLKITGWLKSPAIYAPSLLIALTTPGKLVAQQYPAMAKQVVELYNAQDAAGIYALTDSGFHKAISQTAFEQALKQQLFPLGKITGYSPEDSTQQVHYYKCMLGQQVVLRLVLGINNEGRLHTLAFTPWKPKVPKQDTLLWHDNALTSPLDSQVHQAATQYLKNHSAPGLSMGVLQGTKAWFYNYGYARHSTQQHPTAHTQYEIGSITKTFTSLLLADAVVNKKAKLTDPITMYLPDSVRGNKNLKDITLEHLANHTSGLPRLPINLAVPPFNPADPYANFAEPQLMQYLKTAQLSSTPGSTYSYSNLAMGLLGVILERIYGLPYEALLKEKIFTPFKMAESYSTSVLDSTQAAQPTAEDGSPTSYWNFKALAGAGAIKSTTTDLLRYALQYTLKPRTKGQPDARLLLTEKPTHTTATQQIALGWHLSLPHSTPFIMEHSGGTGGFSSYLGICPQQQVAIAVLVNSTGHTAPDAMAKPLLQKLAMQ